MPSSAGSPDRGDEHAGSLDPRAADAAVAITAVARRLEAAVRIEPSGGEAILQSIVDATVALFRAEAASLAMYETATDQLVFRVASGERGQGVLGLRIAPGEGVAGYVFATGRPLVVGDVGADPRFERSAAEQTGYVPRSLLAVPLIDDGGSLGVLEVLDRVDGGTFSLHDIDVATVFARQASIAIGATRLERSGTRLLRDALVAVAHAGAVTGEAAATDGPSSEALPVAEIEALVASIAGGLGAADDPVWRIADRIGALGTLDPADADFVIDILDALARRSEAARRRGRRVER